MIFTCHLLAPALICLLCFFFTAAPVRGEYGTQPSALVSRSTAVFKGFVVNPSHTQAGTATITAKPVLVADILNRPEGP